MLRWTRWRAASRMESYFLHCVVAGIRGWVLQGGGLTEGVMFARFGGELRREIGDSGVDVAMLMEIARRLRVSFRCSRPCTMCWYATNELGCGGLDWVRRREIGIVNKLTSTLDWPPKLKGNYHSTLSYSVSHLTYPSCLAHRILIHRRIGSHPSRLSGAPFFQCNSPAVGWQVTKHSFPVPCFRLRPVDLRRARSKLELPKVGR